ncbi:hypothetical protein PMAYCL1PPCAC_21223 [Pristionchus mayeri]|uniref:F-box domain-containing protein n=1 Tax=Pristionchus mayeri TaxID=1317129 RepID=A0AAN5I3U0_9BILA|nr:hypothetical protein PMAYCL1PPCAC_21223 [Pristionchus mayeri]
MDIFSLPEVFLNMLMRTMNIKDRLNIRLTCRFFDQLVANSHAGFFDVGMIANAFPNDPRTVSYCRHFGLRKFHDSREAGLEKFLDLRNRLFSGITFGCWEFRLSDTELALPFLLEFSEKFKAEKVIFQVDTKQQFQSALELVAKFPESKVMMDLGLRPSTEQLRSLPPMDELQITTPARERIGFSPSYNRATRITRDLFFKLLAIHRNLYLDNVEINSRRI